MKQLAELVPLSEKVAGLNPRRKPFWVKLACSLCACVVFSGYSGFLPQSKSTHVRFNDNSMVICLIYLWATFTLQANVTQIHFCAPCDPHQILSWQSEHDKCNSFSQICPRPFQYVALNWIHLWCFSKGCSVNGYFSLHLISTSVRCQWEDWSNN